MASNANCSDTTTFEVIADNASLTELNGSNWLLYPNPVGEELNILRNGAGIQYFIISDLSGKIYHEFNTEELIYQINLEGLSPGYYLISCPSEPRKRAKPFVKLGL